MKPHPDVRPKSMKDVVAAMREQGAQIRLTKGGHYVAIAPNGRKVFYPQTPSDHRVPANVWRKWVRTASLPPTR